MSSSKTEANTDFHIVGVGASAGGLEAIENLFKAMPEDTGAAFVVVQHLSPDFKSHMGELLARKTNLAIKSIGNDDFGSPVVVDRTGAIRIAQSADRSLFSFSGQ